MLPNEWYVLIYLAVLLTVFGYIVYQRLAWRVLVGTLIKREVSTVKVLFGGPHPAHPYRVEYSFDGVPMASSVVLNVTLFGWRYLSAENQSAVLLVNPQNPKSVKLLYLGDTISTGRVWVTPAMALILTVLFSWLIVDGFSSSLSGF